MKKKEYFPEIDGLRAIAVLGVIFFHLDHSYFKGGFVGVDIIDSSGNLLFNNYINERTITIRDYSAGFINYLVYNNSFGEVKWLDASTGGFLENLTTGCNFLRAKDFVSFNEVSLEIRNPVPLNSIGMLNSL